MNNPHQFDDWTIYHKIDFINSTNGYVTGNSGKIIKTTDGGTTWSEENSSIDFNVTDIKITNLNTVYMVHVSVFKTINANLNASIKNIKNSSFSYSLYPNPTDGIFTMSSTSEGQYLLMNELGQAIQLIELNVTNKYTADIENLSAGVYFVVGRHKNETIRQKIVVIK